MLTSDSTTKDRNKPLLLITNIRTRSPFWKNPKGVDTLVKERLLLITWSIITVQSLVRENVMSIQLLLESIGKGIQTLTTQDPLLRK